MSTEKPFEFEFSLEVLNHLGRGLYRSFATVVAEAISNAWDAEATEVHIIIDKEKKSFEVRDNGKGMDEDDFRRRFLKVGYSRRDDPRNKSSRVVIGRKGIGKLAMLSISNRVKIISKKKDCESIGGIVNNGELDKEIGKDGSYKLGVLSDSDKKNIQNKKSGTHIIFEELNERMNSEDIIRKYMATQFNFLFSRDTNEQFDIFINDKKISSEDLKDINEKTQFIWFLATKNEGMEHQFSELKKEKVIEGHSFKFEEKSIPISGFIASTVHPKHLTIRGNKDEFKASVNLFCNGRLRQENILQEIPSRRIVESYLYGEIHVNEFDSDDFDRFTSSREGVMKDDKMYKAFLDKLKDTIKNIVIEDWDAWRVELREAGDPDNIERMSRYKRSLVESKNSRSKDFEEKIDSLGIEEGGKKQLKTRLRELSEKNTQVYQDLFILENLYREYIKSKHPEQESLSKLSNKDNESKIKEIKDRVKKVKKDREENEERHELKGEIVKTDSYLNYVDFVYLGILIDQMNGSEGGKRHTLPHELDVKAIMPVRNPVMHTNEITDKVMEWNKIKNVIEYMDKIATKTKE